MHPAYRWGDPYPYHANPMHYAPNDDPRAKEISSHMKMDPSTLSSPYQPWPYGGNYCYPGPQECHGGYNHGYFGGPYSFRPPYPYYPPPPPQPYHTHGFYPPFPGAYPAYSIPPPHYSIEQPRYDYDKNTHGSHHCCGCNHREDEKKLRIEQEKPEIDKKTGDSSVPFLLKDYPYPIMWVPPGFMNTESKTKEKEKHSHKPVPLEPLEPSKQDGNGETGRDQQRRDDNHLPFPIFWFPSKNNEVGEKNVNQVASKASPFSRSEAESETGSKPAVQKVIPVKQLGTEEENKSLKSIETKAKSDSVEKKDKGMEGKASPKTSKLPPVCLRIDPLPRKKNSSRSPSPPGDKGRSKGSPINNSKSSEQQTQLSEGLKKSKEEQSEGNIKTIKVVEKDSLVDPCENVPKGEGNGSEKGIVCKEEKKRLSENEAALIIQSVCRGFQVRKSKPITKMRQIAEVGKQVVELRNRIRDLESSSSGICFDDKQKLVIGETIMSLLLKLDTIQGLHPVVRDVRKWVAKELVGLQEKLDSLTSVKPETRNEDSTKRVEDDAVQEKSETQFVESAMGLCEKREVEGTGSDSTNLEAQMELQNEESSGELNDKQVDEVMQDKLASNGELNDKQLDDVIQNKLASNGELNDKQPDGAIQDKLASNRELNNKQPDGVIQDKPASSGERNNKQPDDVIQDKSESQSQLDSNVKVVESGMGLCEVEGAESSHSTNLKAQMELQNEESSGELNDKQLNDDIQDKLAESDSKCEVEGAESPHNTNLKAQMELQNEESSGELNNKQLNDDIQDKLAESDGKCEAEGAESAHNTNLKAQMELQNEESSGELNNKQLNDDIQDKLAESDGKCEAEGAESPHNTNLEPQMELQNEESSGELNDKQLDDVIQEKIAECDMNVEAESREEIVEMLESEEYGEKGEEVKVNEEKVMEEVVKEQMGVIRELTSKVKDLEKKLSKYDHKMKKLNKKKKKGRRSVGCVVEEELS